MKIFILEDNEHKLQQIIDILTTHFGEKVSIEHSRYFNEGVSKLISKDFDYAILDNNLPRFPDSNEFVIDAAEDILEWLWLKKKNTKCIICSSEPFKLTEKYINYIGAVKYDSFSVNWEFKLLKLIT